MPIIFKGIFTSVEEAVLKEAVRQSKRGKERIEVTHIRNQYGIMAEKWPVPHWERSVDELVTWFKEQK